MKRLLLVFDGKAWFIRHVCVIIHDYKPEDGIDEKVYRCDRHMGGPFRTFDTAARAMRALLRKRPAPARLGGPVK